MLATSNLTVSIKNEVSEVLGLNEELSKFFQRHNVPREVVLDIHLCVEEILLNTISYGYKDLGEHEIRVRLDFLGDRLEIRIIDDGQPFNPLLARPPDIEATMEHRRIGGLGIHLVRNLMDRMEYLRVEDLNELRLTKLLD